MRGGRRHRSPKGVATEARALCVCVILQYAYVLLLCVCVCVRVCACVCVRCPGGTLAASSSEHRGPQCVRARDMLTSFGRL